MLDRLATIDQFNGQASEAMTASTLPRESALPVEAHDAVRDAREALTETMSAGSQLTKDLAELKAKEDLIPLSGMNRLKTEAREEARTRSLAAERRFTQAVGQLESALADQALGKVATDRELLGRDLIRTVVGDATGGTFAQRVMGLAKEGDPEALGVLNTPWMKSFAISREAQVDRLQKAVRTIVQEQAAARGDAGYSQLQSLKKAQAYARSAFRLGFDGQ